MSNMYVRSTTGNDANSGVDWANAKATVAGAIAAASAGADIYISQAHSESNVASIAWAIGTLAPIATPSRFLGVNDGATPPTALSTATPSVSTTNAGAVTVSGNNAAAYFFGLTFTLGDSTNGPAFTTGGSGCTHHYDKCTFFLRGSGAGAQVVLGGGHVVKFTDCWLKCSAADQGLFPSTSGCFAHWRGGGLLAGGTSPTSFLRAIGSGSKMLLEDVDLSNASASINLCPTMGVGSQIIFRNCKLPASWTGLLSSASAAGAVAEMHNCDAGDTNYRYQRSTQWGDIYSETSIVLSGGATDGATPISWKLVSASTAKLPHLTLDTGEIVVWNEATGSPITASLDFIHDSATALKNDEVWMDVEYLGTSGYPLAVHADSNKSDVLAANANVASSTATWLNTGGMTNPNKQKLSVTFTPVKKGFLLLRVRLAKASKTIYVNPRVTGV
jgi:hypothetical protein